MTEHNQKIFDGMIKKLEEQRLKLFRSAAQLDNTIGELRRLDTGDFRTKLCIQDRMTYREAFLSDGALPRDEESTEIMQDALSNFE